MKILIKNKEYVLQETGKFGREGEIYSVLGYSQSKLAKVYDVDRRTAYTQRKVTALINKFRNFNWGGMEDSIAFPEFPLYDAATKSFCGFLMKNFNNHSDFFDNRFDLENSSFKNTRINDEIATSIIVTLFSFLRVLHKAGFILGDVNPDNVLLNNDTLMPVLIDFDSSQIGTYYSNTNRQTYIDSKVRADGYGSKRHFIYTTDSDIYALAIVSYEFMVGIHPYFFQTSRPTDTEYKKANGLSILDYLESNRDKTDKFDFEIFENAAYEATVLRLNEIKAEHKEIYAFFKSVFVEGKRNYFSMKESKIYNLSSSHSSEEDDLSIVEILPASKGDPDELDLFMKQFDLSI